MHSPRSEHRFHGGPSVVDHIGPCLPTIAEPAWFAPPVDVHYEDDRGVTIVFHVSDYTTSDLRVEASGRNVFVWGPRIRKHRARGERKPRAMRVFALPFEVAAHELRMRRNGELLHVRIQKKVARVAPASSVDAA